MLINVKYLKSKSIILVFSIVLILKFLSFYQIEKNRNLPIEPDDAFIYMTHAFLLYEDKLRQGKTWESLKDFIFSTYDNEKSDIGQDVTEVSKIERVLTTPRYFLYAKIFGLIDRSTKIDKVKIWWIINYITQLLILISFYCLIQLFFKKNNNFYKSILLIASFFLLISIKLHIMATPTTIGCSIYLISIYLILKSKKNIFILLGYFLNFVALHFHPSVFLISGIFISYFLIFLFFDNNKIYFKNFLKLLSPVFIALFLEQTLSTLDFNRYLGIFETEYIGQDISKISGLIEIFKFNFPKALSLFLNMFKPWIPFFLHAKLIMVLIYFFSIYIAYKNNKNLFVLNLISLCLFFIGCFYFISIKHPGILILYTSHAIIPLIILTIFSMYFSVSEYLEKKFGFKKYLILSALVTTIFINNTISYYNVLEKRINDENYENIIYEIMKFKEDIINKPNDVIIIGDDDILWMFTSLYSDTHIYLSDSMRKNDKFWSFKKNYNVKGYIGKVNEKMNSKEKGVYVSKRKYYFNNIKKFDDFYFLYN